MVCTYSLKGRLVRGGYEVDRKLPKICMYVLCLQSTNVEGKENARKAPFLLESLRGAGGYFSLIPALLSAPRSLPANTNCLLICHSCPGKCNSDPPPGYIPSLSVPLELSFTPRTTGAVNPYFYPARSPQIQRQQLLLRI